MGLVYFRRYRMRCDLTTSLRVAKPLPPGLCWRSFDQTTVADHAAVKYESFVGGLDSYVFACLSRREGCLRLMREIASRKGFVADATWLIEEATGPDESAKDIDAPSPGHVVGVGTIQGLEMQDDAGRRWGSIQNVGVVPSHRGRGLGAALLQRSAEGFRAAGLDQMRLEVTTDNVEAVALYRRLGFVVDQVVYKAAEVSGTTLM